MTPADEFPDDRAIIERIASLDVIEPPPGWQERAYQHWKQQAPAPRHDIGRWLVAALVILATVAAIVVVPRCRTAAPTGVTVAMELSPTQDRDGRRAVKRLTPRLVTPAVHAELRVYRDGALIARCPGDAGCRRGDGVLAIELLTPTAGRYEVVGLTSKVAIPPSTGQLELDLIEARDASASTERRAPIEVP